MVTEVVEVHGGQDPRVDLDYWKHLLGPIIGSLLKSTGSYSPADQDEHLRVLSEYVIPNLGPRPSVAHTSSFITQTGCPLQPSIYFCSSGKPLVRYSWELLGPRGGSDGDPFAIEAAQKILSFLSTTVGFCTRWTNALLSAFSPTPEEVKVVQAMIPKWLKSFAADEQLPQIKRLCFCFVAFDLKGPKASIKAYFNIKAKSMATGVPENEITWNVLRNLMPSFDPALIDTLGQFLAENPASAVDTVAVDCVDEASLSNARVKLYVVSANNSFNAVRDYITLGGRFQNKVILKGLALLQDIWHLLLQEPEGIVNDDYNKRPNHCSPMSLYINFEIRPDTKLPEVKIYLPLWNYVRSDEEAVNNYEEVFRRCGYEWGKEGMYWKAFESALYALPFLI
ncbi:tryptophan dimethylallyltransferase domain-containing protein [Hirsutella rhossiliensis]|uniref:Tryptophan dimethylallyltransferase domain-containing protein n=1 Tax=Hirsutella rhossiliensis TaxID=111463 RepID=A0A9P8N880_9HYPO|nr:tryptophan dimethylallyltransferase domain-containing protein [Hirsutella rhossiliensis]KAH0968635.1 tryptophan dimethylallyltransferase domain-containing protein [Hirsutella rhossiliensis]